MEFDISGLESGIPVHIFGQQLILFSGLIYVAIALAIMLVLAVMLRVASNKQDRKAKPSAILVITETLWKFSGGPVEGITKRYKPALHIFAANLFTFLLLINTTGMWGVDPPASNVFIALSLGILTGIMVHGLGISSGLGEYFKGYFQPFALLFPLNVMEVFSQIISISMRLFGNMLAGIVLAQLLRMALDGVGIGFAYIVAGGFLSMYSDLFIATIQSLIFMTLTISYIKGKIEHLA